MTDPTLSGLNYNAPVKITDLDHLEATYTDEFVRRLTAVLGAYRAAGASFGILSEFDPIDASSLTEPLFVEQNSNDGMTINVHPGSAAAENGMLLWLSDSIEQLEMVNQDVGQQNVVYIEYIIIDDEDTKVKNRHNVHTAVQRVRTSDTSTDPLALRTLQVASMEDWNDSTLYPPDRREGIVPIALVEIISKTTAPFKEVQVDLSRITLTINRPWFSPVDIQHRAEVGTGSSTVPHSLALSDLSQGNLTLYDQLLNHGMVISRDIDVPGVPGSLCIETVTPARIEVDDDGSMTGQIGQQYVELTRFPTRLLGAYGISDNTNEILVDLIPHSNLLAIHPSEHIPEDGFRVQYSASAAGEALVNSLISDEVHFRQPDADEELVISGGSGYTEVNPSFIDSFNNIRGRISLGTAPQIPKLYRVLMSHDGELIFTPQHILCATRLDDLGFAVYSFTTAMLGAARVRVGLQNVSLTAATSVRVRLTGIDHLGAAVTEDLIFNETTYEVPIAGTCEENDKNFRVTDTVFASIQTLIVLERTADGPSTAISVYADLDPTQTAAIRDACPLAEVMWDGNAICRVRDIRRVSSRLEMGSRTSPVNMVEQTIVAMLALQDRIDVFGIVGDDTRDPYKYRLVDPIRLYKFADGLRSTILPEQPGVEVLGLGPDQDLYTTQALCLQEATGGGDRYVHVSLVGRDAQQYRLNGIDGIAPRLEYRYALTTDPEDWLPWVELTTLQDSNGSNYRVQVSNLTFKIQFRVKGSTAGIVAVQYTLLGRMMEVERTSQVKVSTGENIVWESTYIQDEDAYAFGATQDEIVILKAGRHKIGYSAIIETDDSHYGKMVVLHDSGSGFLEVNRSRGWTNLDATINLSIGTVTGGCTIEANAGNKIVLFGQQISGGGDMFTNAASLTIEKADR